jgi:dihydrodipicolinate synthase/N-acetylneuraminate lyase
MLLEGLHIPLTTAFYPDGRLNLPKLAANITRYAKSPAAGMIVLGATGESTLLTEDETRDVLRTAGQAAAPEKVLLAGVWRDSVQATLTLAELAAEFLYDAILVGFPSILGSQAHTRELLVYFQSIADRSPLPLVLYSDSTRNLPIDTIVELAGHPSVLGLLDGAAHPAEIEAILRRTATIQREVTVTPVFSAVTVRMKVAASHAPAMLVSADSLTADQATASIAQSTQPLLRTRTKTVGFQILTGDTQTIHESLRAGARGTAPALAACAPQACYEVLAAWKDDDQPLAEEKQARLCEAARVCEAGIGNLKYACELNGYFGGWPRLPLLPPTGSQRAAVERLMKTLRN